MILALIKCAQDLSCYAIDKTKSEEQRKKARELSVTLYDFAIKELITELNEMPQ